MNLRAAHKDISDMTAQVRAELHTYRHTGDRDDDDQFIRAFIARFVQAAEGGQRAGLVHMALSLYRMAVQQDLIAELTDDLGMRDDALALMFALSDEKDRHHKKDHQ
jgi:hypothetical protein